MKARLLVATLIIVGLASPAVARSYYVVESTKTHKCSVLPKKPKGKTVVIVKGSAAYKTKAEARAAFATFAPCKT
jgi:predicted secreted protein